MQNIDIKQLMDNYNHETATPEERAEAERFMNFLASQADLEGTLAELKHKHADELREISKQERKRIIWAIVKVIIMILTGILYYWYLAVYK